MELIKFKLDGKIVEVEKGKTILEAARQNNIKIPTLCYLEDMNGKKIFDQPGSCRMCVVEIKGRRNLAPSCVTKVAPDIEVTTNNERVHNARKTVLDLILSNHPLDCLTCEKAGNCQLQDLCYEFGLKGSSFEGAKTNLPIDDSNQFFIRDMNKCILCRKCVNICRYFQGTSAITFSGRGFDTHVSAPFDYDIETSTCVSCGNCVSVCPTGALIPKTKEKFRSWEVERTKTTCTYCGVGCQMNLLTKDNKVVGVEPAQGGVNNGLLCVKGKFGYEFINHPDRLKTPLIKRNGKFEEATWDEAYKLIAKKTNEIKQKYGSDSIAGLSSARCTNEENYLFQKMVRAVIGTNNVDHCARLCHASTVAGLATTLGSGAMTNSIEEVIDSEVIFVTGSNTTDTHPVIGAYMRQAKDKGAKIIVAEPRRIDLANDADVFLQIKPGTNVAMFNGFMNVIISEGLEAKEYIKERTENYEELKEVIAKYTPEVVAEICKIDAEDLIKAARIYGKASKASIFYAMGVTQHSTGTQGVMSSSNLALLCGNIGIESAGVNPLRGQNNVQGACDMGALPADYPGYQKVFKPEIQEKFEKAWGVKLSDKGGLTVTEIMPKAGEGEIKMIYIMGENPMISDPDINHVEASIKNLDFLVVQDIFMSETAELADVVLPASTFAEKDGTFTSTERKVQRIREAIKPLGDSKPDWQILMEVMKEFGYDKNYNSASEIMDEIASLTPSYGGISFERIENDGLQWPCPTKDHPGTKFLHKDKCARGKGLFKPAEYMPSAELPDKDYPFVLTTGRILYHYHTKTMTGRVEGLNNLYPESFIEMHPDDGRKLGIKDGDKVRVSSRRGEITTKAVLTEKGVEGITFMPFHFADGPANILTNNALDPIAKIPELKVCSCNIVKEVN